MAPANVDFPNSALPNRILDTMAMLLFVWANFFLWTETSHYFNFLLAVVSTVVTIATTKQVFSRIGTMLGIKKKKNLRKFADQGWQLTVHSCMTALELYILFQVDWLFNIQVLFDRYNLFVPPALEVLYVLQLAIWFVTVFSHRFIEERHRDYYVMYVHHCITLLLVMSSWQEDYTSIGFLVFFTHDISDIGVDLAKMVGYLKMTSIYPALSWVGMTGLWLVFRLVLFPYNILSKGAFYQTWLCATPGSFCDREWRRTGEVGQFTFYRWFLNSVLCMFLLSVLVLLHIYWFWLMIQIAMAEAGILAGARDTYEGDSDDPDVKKEK